MPSISYLRKSKAARLKWSRNANAAKARKRLEREHIDRPPAACTRIYENQWEVTIRNLVDGEAVTWKPTSLNDLKRRATVIFANYSPTPTPTPTPLCKH